MPFALLDHHPTANSPSFWGWRQHFSLKGRRQFSGAPACRHRWGEYRHWSHLEYPRNGCFLLPSAILVPSRSGRLPGRWAESREVEQFLKYRHEPPRRKHYPKATIHPWNSAYIFQNRLQHEIGKRSCGWTSKQMDEILWLSSTMEILQHDGKLRRDYQKEQNLGRVEMCIRGRSSSKCKQGSTRRKRCFLGLMETISSLQRWGNVGIWKDL